jgi:hypothetical protein
MTTARRLDQLRALLPVLGLGWLLAACSTSGGALRLEQARSAYSKGDFTGAETSLLSQEVIEDDQSRLQHYLWLSSVAIAQGLYEKAVFFLERSRELAVQLRSDRGFEFSSPEYKSNPIEFSRIHYLLVISRIQLAESGRTPAWSLPEVRTKGGRVLLARQEFSARVYSPQEMEDFRSKARSDLLAWDSHLAQLNRSYESPGLYRSDPLARILASFVHGRSSLPRERRTAELLIADARREVEGLKAEVSGFQADENALLALLERLEGRAKEKGGSLDESFFLLESGVMPKLRKRKVVIGLSTLFRGIEDPYLRSQLEQIGLRLLLQFAPEFGLVAFGGAIAGAAGADPGEGPVYISDAVDESFGFQISFPEMVEPDSGFASSIEIKGDDGREWKQAAPLVGPLQAVLARETRERSKKEWRERALKVGLEYLAVLIPAVVAYRQATRDGDWIRKLAILSGYFIAKKAIDQLNSPDLRSWSLMPQWIHAACFKLPPGKYQGSWLLENQGTSTRVPIGWFEIPTGGGRLFYQYLINTPSSAKLAPE